MTPKHYELLISLLSQPTAPFREEHISAVAARVLAAAGVPFFDDPLGNLVVGADSPAAYRRVLNTRNAEPLRVFIAHMDHPGFHGVRWLSERVLTIKWHGGSPVKHINGARVWLATGKPLLRSPQFRHSWREDAEGEIGEGVLRRVTLNTLRYGIDTAEVHFASNVFATHRPAAGELFGGFKFRKPVWKSGSLLYTKAADDLVGVFCIVATALAAFGRRNAKTPPPFIGLLTRGEEVGFIGAIGHFELGWLQDARRPLLCVSLEASRTLPGAIVGQGPVVRLGDRRTLFDSGATHLLTELAEKILPKQYQRRIMDGGTCEGTAATAFGFPTLALTVPLGNYHNQGFEGGPDCRAPQGPAPEFVHLDDVEGQRKLCLALLGAHLAWADPWKKVRERLQKNYRDYRQHL